MSSSGPILFLTNNENTRELQRLLVDKGEQLVVFGDRVSLDLVEEMKPSLLLSFNYQYIIKGDVLGCLEGCAFNVHCSLLPFNKGSNPNFFSFYTNTPKGVTVHELTPQLDGGRIVLQSEVLMGEDETFRSSYDKLLNQAVKLVYENWDDIKHRRIAPVDQEGAGSYHTYAELLEIQDRYPFEWDDRVCDWKKRYGLL